MSALRWLWAWTRAYARWIVALTVDAAWTVSYWVRPYDMLADRRRWRWQPRQRCGFAEVDADTMADLLAAVRRRIDAEETR